MWWVTVGLALAQAQDEGRLPGAIPIRREDLAPVAVPEPQAAPPPAVDRSKIKVIEYPDEERSPPNTLLYVAGIGLAVFGAVLGVAMFASRLIAPSEPPDAPR